jgi:hypothetical protein
MHWVLVGVLVVALLVGGQTVIDPDDKTPAVFGREAPDGGFLAIAPSELANAAGVAVDVYTGARIIRSEAGSAHENERAAVLWVALNQCARWGVGLTDGACRGSKGGGYYGAQNAGGRWISTRLAPTADDLQLADSIVNAGFPPDRTDGATKFMHVATQTALHRRDPDRYKAPEVVIADWRADGYEPREVPPVSPQRFLVFVRGSYIA